MAGVKDAVGYLLDFYGHFLQETSPARATFVHYNILSSIALKFLFCSYRFAQSQPQLLIRAVCIYWCHWLHWRWRNST